MLPLLLLGGVGSVPACLDVEKAGGHDQRQPGLSSIMAGRVPSPLPTSSQIVVRFRRDTPMPAAVRAAGRVTTATGTVEPSAAVRVFERGTVASSPRRLAYGLDRFVRYTYPSRTNLQAVMEQLRSRSDVSSVAIDRPVREDAEEPNDTHFGQQWYLHNTGQESGSPGADINLLSAWDLTTGSAAVVVAVVDSGIEHAHPEFAGRIVAGYDFVNDDADPEDDRGHGTKVSGFIAANADNALLLAGVDQNAKIMPLKTLDDEGKGSSSDGAAAVVFATDAGADVVNLSLSAENLNCSSGIYSTAFQYARDAGVIVVVAAGNKGPGTAEIRSPGCLPQAISVSGTDRWDEPYDNSSTGSTVDISAPGEQVIRLEPGDFTDTGWDISKGTSYSAPQVAGVVALMRAIDPELKPDEAAHYLYTSADDQVGPSDLDLPGWDEQYGWGRLNAGAAVLAAADARVQAATWIGPLAAWRYLDDGSDQATAWRALGFDDSGWSSGPGQLGYGDGDETTVISFGADPDHKHRTTWFRHTFEVDDAALVISATLWLLRDDGAVVYLNGSEILRDNMPADGIDYQTFASSSVSGNDEDMWWATPIDPAALQSGNNVLAVEIHQRSNGSKDLSFDVRFDGLLTAPCKLDVHCDDGDACNGIETCELATGKCLTAAPLSCDDGDACNGVEACDSVAGCQAGKPLSCDDGNVCNGVETCDPAQGCQAAAPLSCDDGDPCNGEETCDPALGCQEGTPVACEAAATDVDSDCACTTPGGGGGDARWLGLALGIALAMCRRRGEIGVGRRDRCLRSLL